MTPWVEQKADRQIVRAAPSRTRFDDRTGKIRHQTDMRDSQVLPGPIVPGRPQHSRARAVLIDDELDRAAADSAPLPRLSSPEGRAARSSSARPDARSCMSEHTHVQQA